MMIFQWSILVLTLVQIYASKHRLARQTAQDICPNPDVAFCDFIQCANGRCVEDKASSECFKCECDVGFTGFLCETAIVTPTECNLNCQNGGLCVQPSANISFCACPPGFTGSECETSVLSTHPCVTMPTTVCQNGGICTQDGDGYLCNCPPGWNGKNCETQAIVTQCEANTCGQHGICIQATTQNGPIVLCNCENRWTGKFCDVNLDDMCSMGFCLSGGVCVTAGNVPVCQCPPAYTGIRCETLLGTGSISSTTTTTTTITATTATTITTTTNSILTQTPGNCSTKPCLNGGSCYNAGNSFICLCRQQWTGTTCNTPNAGAITTTAVTPLPNDACASNPCENGGTCYKLGNGGFICVCTAGFTGAQCTVARTTTAPSVTDPTSITCRNQPCENGGTCYSAGNSYFCFCGSKSNFTGKNCETPISTLAADCPLKCAPGQCVRTGGSNQNTYACMCNGILKPTSCS